MARKGKTVTLRSEWFDALAGYPAEVSAPVWNAVVRYAFTGEEPALEGVAALAFTFIKSDIDRVENDAARRADIAKNAAKKRWGKGKEEAPIYNKVENDAVDGLSEDMETGEDNDNANAMHKQCISNA